MYFKDVWDVLLKVLQILELILSGSGVEDDKNNDRNVLGINTHIDYFLHNIYYFILLYY